MTDASASGMDFLALPPIAQDRLLKQQRGGSLSRPAASLSQFTLQLAIEGFRINVPLIVFFCLDTPH